MEVVVTGRREGSPRDVLPGEDRVDPRDGERLVLADSRDPCVRVRRADDLEVKHPLHLDVHRVMGVAGDDRPGEWVGEASSARVAGPVLLDGSDTADRILDRMIAGTSTEVPLEMEGKILLRLLGEARRRHDHPRGAEAALECLGVEKRLLHRMQFAVAGETLERGDLAALGPECRNEATVDRLAIEPDRAGTAIPGVTPFFHSEPAKTAQKGSQALAGTRFLREGFAIDPIVHGGLPGSRDSSGRVPSESVPQSNASSARGEPATRARRRGTG